MLSTEASMLPIEVGFTGHFFTIRCRTPLLRLRMQCCRRSASAMGPAPYSRGAAFAVIEKCGQVPAFAYGERGESGFPGHGKVRLEAVTHPLELHVVPGHQVEDVEGLLEAGQALDLAREQALRPAGRGDHR